MALSLPEAVRQKLLEINGQLKEVCESPQLVRPKSCTGLRGPPRRPITSRPSSARPQTAPGPGGAAAPNMGASRPQSARSASSAPGSTQSAPPSAPMVTGSKVHLEVPKPPRPQVQQEPSSKMDFQALLELVGAKAAARFSSLQQCFRNLDSDSNGKVEVDEIRRLLRIFHMPESAADQFFEHLDTEKTGSLDFQVVADVIGSYIKPGYGGRRHATARPKAYAAPQVPCVNAPMPYSNVQVPGGEVDLNQLADIIGAKAKAKYRKTRDCFRWLDEAKTGIVTRTECNQFMEAFGYPACIGEQTYNALLLPGQKEVDFSTFVRFFGPHIHPRYEEVVELREQLCQSRAPSPRSPPPERSAPRVSLTRSMSATKGRPPTPGMVEEDVWSAAPTSAGSGAASSSASVPSNPRSFTPRPLPCSLAPSAPVPVPPSTPADSKEDTQAPHRHRNVPTNRPLRARELLRAPLQPRRPVGPRGPRSRPQTVRARVESHRNTEALKLLQHGPSAKLCCKHCNCSSVFC